MTAREPEPRVSDERLEAMAAKAISLAHVYAALEGPSGRSEDALNLILDLHDARARVAELEAQCGLAQRVIEAAERFCDDPWPGGRDDAESWIRAAVDAYRKGARTCEAEGAHGDS